MIGYVPECSRCAWAGEPTGDMLRALALADRHRVRAHEDQDDHAPEPEPGSEHYPKGYEIDSGDVPDWMDALCRTCGDQIEWDPRNLWSHAAGEGEA